VARDATPFPLESDESVQKLINELDLITDHRAFIKRLNAFFDRPTAEMRVALRSERLIKRSYKLMIAMSKTLADEIQSDAALERSTNEKVRSRAQGSRWRGKMQTRINAMTTEAYLLDNITKGEQAKKGRTSRSPNARRRAERRVFQMALRGGVRPGTAAKIYREEEERDLRNEEAENQLRKEEKRLRREAEGLPVVRKPRGR
jgi:hypothetical protein